MGAATDARGAKTRWAWPRWRRAALGAALVLLGADRVGAQTSLDELGVSPDASLELFTGAAPALVDDEDAHLRTAAGSQLDDLGPLPATIDLRAYHRDPDGTRYFVVDVPTALGGATFEPRDVVSFDGATYALHFDGSAHGLPASARIAGFARDGSSDLLAFDVPVVLAGATVETRDVVEWDGASAGLRFAGAGAGLPPSAAIDGVGWLSTGRLLLSLTTGGSVGGVAYEDEDVLEYDPAADRWMLSVDGSDFAPAWRTRDLDALFASDGPANVGAARPARLYTVPVDQTANPATFELRLDCGDRTLSQVTGRMSLPPGTDPATDLQFGECFFVVPGVLLCGSGPRFGATVEGSSAFAQYNLPGVPDMLEFLLPGAPLLCTPGQDVRLADIDIANPGSFVSAPTLGEAPDDWLGAGGEPVPEDQTIHQSGSSPANAGWFVVARPLVGDTTGTKFEVLLRSDLPIHQIKLGLSSPLDLQGGTLSFGGCATPMGGDNAMSCAGATELGGFIDPAASTTIGPSAGLAAMGARTDTLYLTLKGTRPSTGGLPTVNIPGQWASLGILTYAAAPPQVRPPPSLWLNPLTALDELLASRIILDDGGGYVPPDCPPEQNECGTGGGNGSSSGGAGADADGDGESDPNDTSAGSDVCVGSVNNADSGGINTTVADGVGDDCQCGDVADSSIASPDGVVDLSDVLAVRLGLSAQALAPGVALEKCNVRGPIDATIAPDDPLRADCGIEDVAVLLRAVSSAPLDSPDLQRCDAP